MINESQAASVKHISRIMAAAVIAFLLIICVFATSAFAGMATEYNVVIDDNGRQYTVTTNETEPTEILNEANIALGSNDRLDIAGFTAGNGGTIVIDRLNTVNIQYSGAIKAYDVYADTVGEAFAELKMNVSGCKLNYDVNDAVENGMVITVEAPLTVTVLADGNTYELNTAGGTVADVISLAGITLGDADYCEPSVDTAVESGMEITVCRTVVKTETVSETIKYSTETKNDDSMTVGEAKGESRRSKRRKKGNLSGNLCKR